MIKLSQLIEQNIEVEKDKSCFTRDNIVSDMLKKVIIRVDFARNLNFDSFVQVAWDEGLFITVPEYEKRFGRSLPNYILNYSSSAIEKSIDSTIHHFHGQDCATCPSVSLDITDNAFILVVDVNQYYEGSKDYSKLIANLCYRAHQHNPLLGIRRIGVRKIDEIELSIRSQRQKYFSPRLHILDDILPLKKTGEDVFGRELVEISLIKDIEYRNKQRVDVSKDKTKIRVIFEMDAFCRNPAILNSALKKDSQSINKLIYNDIQDNMFNKYREWMSYEYLKKHEK